MKSKKRISLNKSDKKVIEVQFLKNKPNAVKELLYGEKYLDFYFPDSAFRKVNDFEDEGDYNSIKLIKNARFTLQNSSFGY